VGSKIEGGVLWPVRDGVGVGDGVGVWVDAWMEGGRLAWDRRRPVGGWVLGSQW